MFVRQLSVEQCYEFTKAKPRLWCIMWNSWLFLPIPCHILQDISCTPNHSSVSIRKMCGQRVFQRISGHDSRSLFSPFAKQSASDNTHSRRHSRHVVFQLCRSYGRTPKSAGSQKVDNVNPPPFEKPNKQSLEVSFEGPVTWDTEHHAVWFTDSPSIFLRTCSQRKDMSYLIHWLTHCFIIIRT